MRPTRWTSPHLHLRHLASADLPAIEAMLAKERVCAQLFFGPNTPELTRGYFVPLLTVAEAALAEDRLPPQHLFALLHPATGVFMGEAALQPIDYGGDNYLIGYQLDDPFWRQGFGTWTARFLVQLAFGQLEARRLSGDCLATNRASARILESVGFRPEGRQRAYYVKAGQPMDRLLFGLLRADLDPARLAAWRETFTAAPLTAAG